MASYYPLVINTVARTINQLAAGDDLDMTSSNIANLSNLQFAGQGYIVGNVTYTDGIVDLGDVDNVKLQGGADLSFLRTDGTGNLTWAVPSLTALSNGNTSITLLQDANINFNIDGTSNIAQVYANGMIVSGNLNATTFVGTVANGNSNVRIDSNSNVSITSNGLSNIFIVSSNGVRGSTRIQDDLVVTGNLTVAGNTSYVQANSLVVQDPIIEVGGGPNGDPLTTNDGKDRGLLAHYYTTQPVDAWIGWKNANSEWNVGSNVTIANDVVGFNDLGNIRASYFIGANGIVSLGNVDIAGTLRAPVADIYGVLNASNINGAIVNGTSNVSIPVTNGNVLLTSAGNTAVTVTGLGANVTGYVTATANITAPIFMGVLANGTSNVSITANANVTVSANGNTLAAFVSSGNGNVQTTGANIFGYLTATGNVTAPNLMGALANGTSNVLIPAVNGNVNVTANNVANVLVIGATSTADNFILTRGNANISGNLHVLSNNSLRLGNGTYFAGIRAASTGMTANYVLTMPTTAGAANQWLMVDAGGNLRFSNTLVRYSETVVTASASGTISPNLNSGTIFRYTLTGPITINTLANVAPGSSAILAFQQDATGGRTVTWGSSWLFAGNVRALSAAPNTVDVVAVFYDGTNYLASLTRGYE